MIRKLYKYTGSISSFSYRRNSPEAVPSVDMILYDINDDDKAPIRISAAGGLPTTSTRLSGPTPKNATLLPTGISIIFFTCTASRSPARNPASPPDHRPA